MNFFFSNQIKYKLY